MKDKVGCQWSVVRCSRSIEHRAWGIGSEDRQQIVKTTEYRTAEQGTAE